MDEDQTQNEENNEEKNEPAKLEFPEGAAFLYFSPHAESAVTRFGSSSLIGATRGPKGYVINPDAVVAIPVQEVRRFISEYRKAVANESLVQKDEDAYNAFRESRKTKTKEASKDSSERKGD